MQDGTSSTNLQHIEPPTPKYTLFLHPLLDPSFIAALSGRLDLASQMTRAVITPLARVSGELYTATDAQGTLVGCAIWAPPGRTTFDTWVLMRQRV